MDVRSFGGFSGSPAFVQFLLPTTEKTEWPAVWYELAQLAGNDPSNLGGLHTFTHWWGMFVGHHEETGIGVVIRDVDIIDFLGTPEVQSVAAIGRRRIAQASALPDAD